MSKKEIITPILIIGLTFLFATICIAVFFTMGKSKKWISRKIMLGAVILSLTSIAESSCTVSSCYWYNPKLARQMKKKTERESVKIKEVSTNSIKGKLLYGFHERYSFQILDSNTKQIVEEGSLSSINGEKFQNRREKFEINFKQNLNPGQYLLEIYAEESSFEEHYYKIESITIQVRPS